MLFGKIGDVGAACSNCTDFGLEPLDAFIRVHMQLGDKAASYEAYSHFWHPVLLSKDGFSVRSASLLNEFTCSE